MNSKHVKNVLRTLAVREMQKQNFLKVAIISLCVHKFAKIIKKAIVMAEC